MRLYLALALAVLTLAACASPAPSTLVAPRPTRAAVTTEAMQEARWKAAAIRPERARAVRQIAARLASHAARYRVVAKVTGVPWPVIATLHEMECGGNFEEHLHNGDCLTARTHHVPRGRPRTGRAPFAWEVSAVDALRYDRMDRVAWARRGAALQAIEAYNGLGYQRHGLPSPYLWSWTSVYARGKYTDDGRYNPRAVSQQCGAAPLLQSLHAL